MGDIYRQKMLFEKISDLLPLLLDSEKEPFIKILNESNELLNKYNWENKVVLNITKQELGMFKSTCKKVIGANYKDLYDDLGDEIDIYDLIDKTEFSDHLTESKVLLGRKVDFYKLSPLEKSINDCLKSEILREFKEKNKQILK